jgi:Family of unknown function (DUF6264)
VTTPPPAYGPPPGPQGQQPSPYGPSPSSPYGYAVPPPAGKRPVRTWDVVLTIVLLVLDLILTAIMSFFGLFLAMASDSCGVRDCNTELIATGMMVGVGLPWLVLIITIVVAIVMLVRRRLAFWVPIVGGVLIVGSLILGFVVAGTGVPAG